MLVLYVRLCVCSVVSNSLQLHGLQPTRLLCPWDSPGKNTRVGCHFFLQGIFLTRDGTGSPGLAGGFFTIWTTREALLHYTNIKFSFYFITHLAAAAKSLQSWLTLCDPIDGSPPGSPVPGILQARTLEWVAISFSIVWKWKVKVKSLSCVTLVVTLWTAAYQAPPSMGFPRQEYWSGLLLPSPYSPWCIYIFFALSIKGLIFRVTIRT